jgi:hypothetical protein
LGIFVVIALIDMKKTNFSLLATVLLGFWWMAISSVWSVTSADFQSGSVSNAGFTMPYRYYVPGNDTTTLFPLVLFLHGSGEVGSNNTSQLNNRANGAFALIEDPSHPAIMIAPQLNSGFWGDPSRQILIFLILDQIRATYNVDPNHIYITGLSYGAAGTWNILGAHSDYFAAAVPISGSINNDARALVDEYAHVPMWLFHGDSDTTQHTDNSRWAATEVRKRGYNIIHTEYTSTGHTGWVQSYESVPLRNWLFAQSLGVAATGLPNCQITSPTANDTFGTTSPTINLSGSVTPPTGLAQVSSVAWKVLNAAGTQTSSGSATLTGGTWTANNLVLSAGVNLIQVIATGPSWNAKTGVTTVNDTLRVTYTAGADTTAPVVTINAPTSNATYSTNAATLNLGGSASDNVSVTQVTWVNNRGGSGTASGTTTWSVNGVALQLGTNVLTVTAQDAANNVSTDVLTVNYSVANQAPVVNAGTDQTITLPTNIANLDATVSDDGLPSGTVTTTWSKVSGPGTVTFGSVSANDTTATFSLAGVYVLRLVATDGALSAQDDMTVTVQAASGGTVVTAINCGKTAAGNFTGSDGTVYVPDSMPPASGGTATVGASYAIAGTTDDTLFDSYRWGTHAYNIPIGNGTYQVTLRFSDNATAANVRKFNVAIEGAAVLTNFDIFAEVGTNTVCDKVFTVPVSDGTLNIQFTNVTGNAKINAIVVKTVPFVPTMIAAIDCGKTAAGNFTGSDGIVYVPDSVPPASGGTATVGASYAIAGTTDDTLFDSYRYGTHSYNLSVANGNYEVRLRFSDNATAANVRKFNVAIEGAAVLTNFDIFAEVGTNTVCDKVFIVPVTDGILNIQFTNVTNNAKINAIVVNTAP